MFSLGRSAFFFGSIIALFLLGWLSLFYAFVFYANDKLIPAICLMSAFLSCFSFFFILTLWVFVLAKHFSTHSIQVMDLGETLKKKKEKESPPMAPAFGSDDWASNIAETITKKDKKKRTDIFHNEDLEDSLT